jgi:hypothetical protein
VCDENAILLAMSKTELKRESKAIIDGLSARDLKLVREFPAFVASRDTDAATRELLAIPGFERSLVRGVRDAKAGRVTRRRKVRRDV